MSLAKSLENPPDTNTGERSVVTAMGDMTIAATLEINTTATAAASRRRSVYFGYGSNLWFQQMDKRCPDSIYVGIARLPGWKWFINSRGFANVKPSKADSVYGAVYLLSANDEKELDKAEGVAKQSYFKRTMTIEFIGSTKVKTTPALVYVDEKNPKEGKAKPEYIDRINKGIADAFKIPQEYIDTYMRPFIPAPKKSV